MPRAILFVDDDPSMHAVADIGSADLGYEIIHAYNGVEALSHVLNPDIDVIITDVEMPVMNGIEFCENIKSRDSLKDIPIIFLTAHSEQEVYNRCYAAGGEACVSKPKCLQEMTDIAKRAGIAGGTYKLSRLIKQNKAISQAAQDRLQELIEAGRNATITR